MQATSHEPQTKQRRRNWRRYFRISAISLAALLLLSGFWFHITNPYAKISVVRQPYKTSIDSDGNIHAYKQFDLQVYDDVVAQSIGYWGKSLFLIVQNTYFGSQKAQSTDVDGIIKDIHKRRFDPSKPYLISGDQFSVLYTRNLGVFYNSLLDPRTAHDQRDWENRQRIYLQSALYALDGFSNAKNLTTTLVPIGPKSALLMQAHPGSIPSDTMYGLLYALDALQDGSQYDESKYHLQTVVATEQIVRERKADLRMLLDLYLTRVRDPKTGMIRRHIDLASARDGVVRDSSFYDNIVLWKTLELAQKLGVSEADKPSLDKLKQRIIATYWDSKQGHFKDDLSEHKNSQNYSSDWLIALPTQFLERENPVDREYLEKSVAFIRKERIDQPFPIKYQASNEGIEAPWTVRTFVPNYGGDAIWSYWGAQYITLLAQLANTTGNQIYQSDAVRHRDTYRAKIEQYRGFPETFTAQGDFLQNIVYKSIRQTGWVVQFEQAEYLIEHNEQADTAKNTD